MMRQDRFTEQAQEAIVRSQASRPELLCKKRQMLDMLQGST